MKQRLIFLILLLAATSVASLQAQTPKLDSLREILKKDTTNFDVLKKLAASLADINVAEAMMYAKKARLVALAQGDTSHLVTSSRLIGQIYNRQSNVHMAINELAPLLVVAERHYFKDEIKRILNSLAIAFNNLGEYDKALDYHLRSLTLKEEDHDKAGVAASLNNIGVVYYKLNNLDRALSYWKKCLELKLEINDNYDLDGLYLNLGLCYRGLGDFKKSQENLEKVFATCSPSCAKRIVIRGEYAMGELQLRQNKHREAKSHFEKSLRLSKQEADLEYKMENLISLTEVAFAENDLTAVGRYLRKISALNGKEQFVKPLQFFYRLSSDYYFEKKNFQIANHFDRKHARLADKINSAEMNRRLMEIQINFIERENREKLENQRVLVEAQTKVIANQGVINLLLIGIAALTIILLMILYRLNVRKSSINRRLDELVKERTFELEKNRNELVHSYNEQKIVLGKISRNVASSLATIRGLNNVGKLEHFENAQNYLEAAEDTLLKLTESINGLEKVPVEKIWRVTPI